MSSRTRDHEGLIGGAEIGDRSLASILSAMAEAPDFASAVSYFLTQALHIAEAERAFVMRLDASRKALVTVATLGYDAGAPVATIVASDLANPLALCAMALVALRGERAAAPFATALPWTALPIPQPRAPDGLPAPPVVVAQELVEQREGARIHYAAGGPLAGAPGGIVVVEGSVSERAATDLLSLVRLAGPLIWRLASLHEARESAERLALILDSLPDPVVITGAANEVIAQNARAKRLLEPQEESSPERRRATQRNHLLFMSLVAAPPAAREPSSEARELALVDPQNGGDLYFQVLARPLDERAGPSDAMLSVLRDVTELRRAATDIEHQAQRVRLAETKASSERDRLNLILENVADPILVTDDRANVVLMNDQAERLFQVSEAPRRGRREQQAVRGNYAIFASFIAEFALLDAGSRRARMTLVHPDSGTSLPVEVVSGKNATERGAPIAIVSVLHDLTKEVEIERLYEKLKTLNGDLERRVREATADVAEQNARLQWQSQEVERATKLKSEFLASMSHELRTPINALIGYTALLLDEVLGVVNDRQRDALRRGRAAAEHLLALINDILDLAKIEAGKMPLHIEPVSLSSVVAEVAQQIEPMVRKKQLEFVVDISADCPPIDTDRAKVRQVLINLLSNAAKFTNRGRVSVVARCMADARGGGVRIDVIDSGIGIRERDLHAIWEDFRQVDQSRTREFGGTGLGLSITRKLLERLGGTVSVRSIYGEGSTFSVVLPLRTPHGVGDDLPPPSRSTPGGP